MNQVVAIVDTNYGPHGRASAKFYTHFSLLRTMEGGFGLPCLNHACDSSTAACPICSGRRCQDLHCEEGPIRKGRPAY